MTQIALMSTSNEMAGLLIIEMECNFYFCVKKFRITGLIKYLEVVNNE